MARTAFAASCRSSPYTTPALGLAPLRRVRRRLCHRVRRSKAKAGERHLPVAVRLAGVGGLKIADAGKPDCYGKVFASVERAWSGLHSDDGVREIAPAGAPCCYGAQADLMSWNATLNIMTATIKSSSRQVAGRASQGASQAAPMARVENHNREALAAPAT